MISFFLYLGKKCTYGHKCKFYHPERGSQPQRAVADELRASAKISSVTSKGLLEDALMVKSQSSGQPERAVEAEQSWETPKKQPNPSPRNSFNDLLEDRLQVQSKVEGRRGSSISSSSGNSSFFWLPKTAGTPSSGSLDRWDYPGGSGGGGARLAGFSGPSLAETHHRCESPDLGYSSLVKAYSSLSLLVPQSPECFFPADLRGGSLPSDCSSEGSVSSDSFSPDPLLDDGPKCHHHHLHPHHHHHCSGQYAHPVSHAPPGLGQRSPCSYIPQAPRRQHGFGLDNPPSSVTPHASPRAFRAPSAYIPTPAQNPLLSRFPGEFKTSPQTSSPQSHSQSSPIGYNLMSSLRQDSGFQDSKVFKASPLHLRRNRTELNQQPQHQINWDPHYQPKPYYDPFAFQGLPEVHEKTWSSPWGRQAYSSPHGHSTSSPPPLPQLSLPSITTHKGHLPSVAQHQEPPALGRYQDLRERVFVNLCGIFSPDLVRMVMTRNPHVMDAQELAALILLEKSQHGS